MEVIADTTVLIDIWRYRKLPRWLDDLTGKLSDAEILVPWITRRNFLVGRSSKTSRWKGWRRFTCCR